jgi:two-component system, sensor histidine kinase and response regulator
MNQEQNTRPQASILIVDNTSINLELLNIFLSDYGYKVQVALNGASALMSIQTNLPDLILLAVSMPEMDGFQVYEHLKMNQQTADLPVIFISALDENLKRVKALMKHGVDYITKPFEKAEVLARIDSQLSISRLTKQLLGEQAKLQQEINVSKAAIRQYQQAETALKSVWIKLKQHNHALMELAKNPAINQGDLKTALQAITQTTAYNLAVGRVSIWVFDTSGTYLQCLELFNLSLNQYCEESELLVANYPAYFQALAENQVIVANDAHTDSRTQEYSEFYYQPRNIISVLDTPIRLRGKTVGVVSSEQVGNLRHWTVEDQNFTRSIADLVTLALESRERKRSENLYRELFEGSVDGILVVEINGQYIDCNSSFKKMVGYSLEELQQIKFQDLTPIKWHKKETEIVQRQLQGLAVTFEKEYIRKDGTIFPAELTAYCHKDDDGKPIALWSIIRDISAKKQVQAALIESEQKYRHLVEASQDMIWSLDVEGRFTFVNAAVKQIHGYEPEEMIGRSFSDFLPQEQIAQDLEIFERLVKGESIFQYESTHLAKDGKPIKLMFTAIALFDSEGIFLKIIGTASNITDKHQAEVERNQLFISLKKSEASLAAAQKIARIGSWAWNLLTQKITWSAETFHIYNLEPTQSEPTSAELIERIHPDDREPLQKLVENSIENKKPYRIEYRLIPPNTNFLHLEHSQIRYIEARGEAIFNDQGQAVEIFGTVRDITEHKLTEIALIDSEGKYRRLVETSQDLIWSIDTQGCFTFVNPAFKQIYGYEPEEMLGRPCSNFESPKYISKDIQILQQIFAGNSLFQYELTQLTKDCREIHLLVNANTLFDDQGNVIGATGTATNITKRVQIEAALRESEARFALAVEGVQDGIWDWNIRTGQVYLSPRWKSMLGYEDHELANTIETWQQCLYPEDADHTYAVLGNYLDGSSLIYSVEFRARCKDGSCRWILARGTALRDELGKPYRMCGSHTDISDRKQAEAEIIRSKDLLESVFNESADAIFLVDGDTVLTVDCNRRAVELFEASSKDELLNIAGINLQKEPFTNEEITNILKELTFRGIWSRELEYITKKGNFFWGSMAAKIIHVASRQMHLIRITDISERKRQQDALRLIVEGTASATGSTFMHTCVHYLAEVLQVRHASISESIDPAHTKVRILAFWQGNTWIENQEYIVAGTPREVVLNSQEICYYSQHLQALFPNDLDLVKLNAESYVGVPLIDEGFVLGLLSVLDVKPMAFDPEKISILKIFAARAAAELKRQKVEQVLRQKAKQEKAIAQIIQQMRSSLDIETIFRATTAELRLAINCDRVVVYRFNPDWSGKFVAESVATGWISLFQKQQNNPSFTKGAMQDGRCSVNLDNTSDLVKDTYLQETQGNIYSQGVSYRVVPDIYNAGFKECYVELLEQFQARAYITIPIISSNKIWGLLASYQNSSSREWQATEINIVIQIGVHLGVALQQAELLAQTQQQSVQLAQAKEAAEVANQAKSQFLAAMSHELRTPLNAILGFTQVMNRDVSASPQQQEYLSIILRSGKHLLELINDILEMTKIEAGITNLNETSFDLHRLLDSLFEMLQLGAGSKGLQLSFERSKNLPQYVQTDQGKLRQILINLLDNAIKFTEIGSVTLRVSFAINRPNRRESDLGKIQLYFEVADTGLGIAQEEIELLFEAFTQTETGRKSMEGTGLGLPISRSFVQQMGGELTVESHPGTGTVFRFNIPINLAQTNQVQTIRLAKQVIELEPNQEYRILVVEDDLASRQLLVYLLTSVGFQVREAINGQEAVALWQSWQPHLIWMDIQMPIVDGYQAIQQIRNLENQKILVSPNQPDQMRTPTIIIALTSNAFEEQINAILKTGCDDLMCKPFQENLFFEKMAYHLGVRYRYKTEQSTPQILALPISLTKQDLNVMPNEWVQQLYQAALAMDDQLVSDLIQYIPQTQTHLSNLLMNLVDNFRLDIIIDCIDHD